jgi:membrane protease YdiL (CAAX protease family)
MRAFAAFLGILALALLAGAIVAYPAFLLASHLGSWAFHRVAGRIAMLLLAAEFAWLCRRWRLRRARDYGYGLPWRRFVGQSLLWGVAGVATAAGGAAFLLGADLRMVGPGFVASPASVARLLALGVGSGITVALIEETVMRGALHTAIERESGPWAAALLTAPLFAVMHFFARARIPPGQVGPGSGFDLLLRSFAPLAHPAVVLDSFLAWLAVGLVLSLTRVLTGNIAVAIGLHAGWVVVLRMLMESTVRTPVASVWVGRFDGLLGFWLLPWAAAIAVALWIWRRAWVPYACSPSTSSR